MLYVNGMFNYNIIFVLLLSYITDDIAYDIYINAVQ